MVDKYNEAKKLFKKSRKADEKTNEMLSNLIVNSEKTTKRELEKNADEFKKCHFFEFIYD